MKLNLVEKFYSVQGEGANSGRAAFFVRFAGCNLNCVFADSAVCDTPWRRAQEHITIGELVDWMETEVSRTGWNRNTKPLVVLTGGEPTIAAAFPDLVHELRHLGFEVAVESNGTHWDPVLLEVDHLVVSPKIHAAHPGVKKHSPAVDKRVLEVTDELRYVIAGPKTPYPDFYEHVKYHYVSPILEADGTGTEWQSSEIPQFAAGALARCLEIVRYDPRFVLSLQTHKWMRVR